MCGGEDPLGTEFKLGHHQPGVGLGEHRHPHVFAREEAPRGVHLVIAPAERHVDLLVRLARVMAPPYVMSYDLLAPTEPYDEGRYVFVDRLSEEELAQLLGEYREFFERDARHHLRIESYENEEQIPRPMLVYDQHDFIYAHGPIERFEEILGEFGLSCGPVELPIPHSHHIQSKFDAELCRLLGTRTWKYVHAREQE